MREQPVDKAPHVISWKRLRNESSKSVQKIPTSIVQEQETEPLTSQV